jgi:hypothetical protein
MSENTKKILASAINTFASTFLVVAGATISSGVEWTTAFWMSVAMTAVRAALKAVLQQTTLPILGKRK